MENLKIDIDADGIALITIDMPKRSMNVLNEGSIADYAEAVEKVIADETIKGAVVTSGKPSFIAGADLDWILSLAEADLPGEQRAINVYETVMKLQRIMRRTENGGKPFVAAVNGLALGGGLELCLACTRRIVADDPRIQLGLPEAKVGLLPGGGGTQRFARIMGPLKALPLLLEGRALSPAEALKLGIVDEIVPAADLVSRAKAWILSSKPEDWVKPWDQKGYKAPGDDPRTMEGSLAFSAANAMNRKKTFGNYPNLDAIQKAVYDGINVPLDTALRIESRYFATLMVSDVARNMVRTQFVNLQKANKLEGRPAEVAARKVTKLGVLGAGMMGAAIAHVAAKSGIPVIVIDRDQPSADKVLDHIRAASASDLAKGRTSQAAIDKLLALLTPTTDYSALSGAELVVEAVFEDSAIKADVTGKAEAVLGADAVFASNTSSIPISSLAEASSRPEQFVGIHFFSPVERMPLVEIIMGGKTGQAALALAMDFCRQIRKTPIVVNDGRFFYTSRVFATYTTEGCLMVQEGISPVLIENAGKMAGMPVAPLALCDEISLDLIYHINKQDAKDVGRGFPGSPAEALIERMIEKERRPGKKAGKGFYDYPADGHKRLWQGLADVATLRADQPEASALIERLLVIQALEAARCLEEGIVATPADADVGAYLGWGFAPWTGGPISYIDTIGAAKFVETCRTLEASCGPRFRPSESLVRMAESGERFYALRGAAEKAA
ncbi:3-hydroxyacyl-CoA dehydrogenase NAD-binding domain-containing protein [Aminobacter sp. LjRoot7]|uniref:3-hydroxyacyl-CoA dehydrogenase NAD-binding domain-containing protein n=1 Tax=Aminobacter sp. LjRoot7 TaxID=3342335 RepID=UPI003ED0F01D